LRSPGSICARTTGHWITESRLIAELYERGRFSLLKLINPQKEIFFSFWRFIFKEVLAFAAVLKGEIHQGAVSGHFAVFNFKIQFLNFRNPQISQALTRSFHCIFSGFLPGGWATSYQSDNFVYTFGHFFLLSAIPNNRSVDCFLRQPKRLLKLPLRCADILIPKSIWGSNKKSPNEYKNPLETLAT
jgi:hypothetical protein